MFGGIEDGEGGRNQGKDYQGAREVDTTEHHLGHSHAGLDSLHGESASVAHLITIALEGLPGLLLAPFLCLPHASQGFVLP